MAPEIRKQVDELGRRKSDKQEPCIMCGTIMSIERSRRSKFCEFCFEDMKAGSYQKKAKYGKWCE